MSTMMSQTANKQKMCTPRRFLMECSLFVRALKCSEEVEVHGVPSTRPRWEAKATKQIPTAAACIAHHRRQLVYRYRHRLCPRLLRTARNWKAFERSDRMAIMTSQMPLWLCFF